MLSRHICAGCIAALSVLCVSPLLAQDPMGTAFTYQGQLKQAGVPVTGDADMVFHLWDAETGGSLYDSYGVAFIPIVDGLFTVELDFGPDPFEGEARWLEIEVEFPSGVGNWTTLSPRQPLTVTPYAITAMSTIGVDGYSLDARDGSPTNVVYVDTEGRISLGGGGGTRTVNIRGGMDVFDDDGAGTSEGIRFTSNSYVLAELAGETPIWDYYQTTDTHRFYTGDQTLRMTIASDGNVGIGEANPTAKLHIAGTPGVDGVKFPDGSLQTTAAVGGGGDSLWSEAGTDIFYTAGDVGIGTAAPTSPLHVVGNGISSARISNSASSGGVALVAEASGGSGFTAALDAYVSNPTGYGVFAFNEADSGSGYALFGETSSPDGVAIYGHASNNSEYSTGIGVYGKSQGDYGGAGVYGESTTTVGTAYGVRGTSPWGIGVRGDNTLTGNRGLLGSNDEGVYGLSYGSSAGVRGIAGGSGPAGHFTITDPANTAAALEASTPGDGQALNAQSSGAGPAVLVSLDNPASEQAALYAESNGNGGSAVRGVSTYAGPGDAYGGYFEAAAYMAHAVHGEATGYHGYGVYGTATADEGYGVVGEASGDNARAVVGLADGANGLAVYGRSWGGANGTGGHFEAQGSTGRAVYGAATNSGSDAHYGGYFESEGSNGRGVYAFVDGDAGHGVTGEATGHNGVGVHGTASGYFGIGVYGQATDSSGSPHYGGYFESEGAGAALYAKTSAYSGRAVFAESLSTSDGENYAGYFRASGNNARAVYGLADRTGAGSETTYGGYFEARSNYGVGVYGVSIDPYYAGAGGVGEACGEGSAGVKGISSGIGWAGYFDGSVRVDGAATITNDMEVWGDLTVNGWVSKGGGSFKIDHPLDPENKYLYHSFVESPDMMNVHNGNVVLDDSGVAIVTMPEWFETVNRDCRYQLTPIGAPGPNLYVAEEIHDNQFKIAGGKPGLKVSWQVTGVRQDPFANANRVQVEVDKPEDERGTYLHPEAWGVPSELQVDRVREARELQEREQVAAEWAD